MRRDFLQLLSAIQAVAVLHVLQRERTDDGRLIATLGDYQVARDHLLDTFNIVTTDGVTKGVRDAVVAVRALCGDPPESVTNNAVAKYLGVVASTASYHTRPAVRLGFVVNEAKDRQRAKLLPGDPLPDDRAALPTREELEEAWGTPLAESLRNVETHSLSESEVESEERFEAGSQPFETPFETPQAVATRFEHVSKAVETPSGPEIKSETAADKTTFRRFEDDPGEGYPHTNDALCAGGCGGTVSMDGMKCAPCANEAINASFGEVSR